MEKNPAAAHWKYWRNSSQRGSYKRKPEDSLFCGPRKPSPAPHNRHPGSHTGEKKTIRDTAWKRRRSTNFSEKFLFAQSNTCSCIRTKHTGLDMSKSPAKRADSSSGITSSMCKHSLPHGRDLFPSYTCLGQHYVIVLLR